jgi:hypothetical protein
VLRVLACSFVVLAVAAGCPAALAGDCPAGSTRVGDLCVPDPQAGACDHDLDDTLDPACGGDDCDDGDPAIHPGAAETCNGRDDDCDGLTDEGVTGTWYADADGDGSGAGPVVAACAAAPGLAAAADDCDDAAADVHPGAVEVCNGRDDDCDGFVDEGVALRFYLDHDRDGFGDPADFVDACSAPVGRSPAAFDCDDADADVRPDQAAYFVRAATSGGYDFDCDRLESPRVDVAGAACAGCTGMMELWETAVPPCGGSGTLVSCTWSSAEGCHEAGRRSTAQECR